MRWLMRRLLILLVVIAAGYLIVFGGSSETRLGRKKVTIEIETPEGMARGASAFELTRSTAPWWYPSAVTSATGLKGEAPCVDLGRGRYVFMLLHDQLWEKTMDSYLLGKRDAHERAPYDRTPILVTFDDIADANSVRQLDPDALDQAFGGGTRLARLTVTDTQDRPTRGTLAERFPALHRDLQIAAVKRIAGPHDRTDLRLISWSSFDAVHDPSP